MIIFLPSSSFLFFSLPSSSSIVVAVLTRCFFAILTLSVADMTELSPIRLSPFRRVAVLFVADPTCRRFDRIPTWPCPCPWAWSWNWHRQALPTPPALSISPSASTSSSISVATWFRSCVLIDFDVSVEVPTNVGCRGGVVSESDARPEGREFKIWPIRGVCLCSWAKHYH